MNPTVETPIRVAEIPIEAAPPAASESSGAARRARRFATRLYAMLTKAIDRRRRWDRFPTLFSLALIKGIRDNLRAQPIRYQ
jgi:hypothetical protein